MASIKKLDERKFKITVSNGYHSDGRKIAKPKTIVVPKSVQARSVMQYVSHAAEEIEREVKLGYSEDGNMTFEEFALPWLDRQTKYAVSTLNGYRKLLERTYPHIGQIKLNRLRPIAIEKMLIELRKRIFNGRPIKEVSVQKYLVAISAVLSDAKRNEIVLKNPARMIDLPLTEKVIQVIPTDNEITELITALLDEPEYYRYYYFLKDMATKLRVTASYLSAVETGKRSIPQNWIKIIVESYHLSDIQHEELKQASADCLKSLTIDIDGVLGTRREAAILFAREFGTVDDMTIMISSTFLF